jgi:hypothetical protein
VGEIVSAWKEAYGEDRVNFWIKGLEAIEGRSLSDFEKEEVLDE